MSAAGKMLQVFGESMADATSFTVAEIAVLDALAFCEALNSAEVDESDRYERTVDLSNMTRANSDQPWRLSVHSRTAKNLAERTRPLVRVWSKKIGDRYEDKASLTADGRLALAAIAKAGGK